MSLNVLLLGPQGSGKGTQAQRIAEEYDLGYIGTGDMIRAAIAEGTEFGRRAQEYNDRGALVPDELMLDLIRERLEDPDTENGFVLDGFPRNMAQADALDAMLADLGRELTIVLALQLDDETATQRVLQRGRDDDTPEKIQYRLEIYHRETEPLIERYRAHGIVVPIHGERTINEVFAEIQQALEHAAVRKS